MPSDIEALIRRSLAHRAAAAVPDDVTPLGLPPGKSRGVGGLPPWMVPIAAAIGVAGAIALTLALFGSRTHRPLAAGQETPAPSHSISYAASKPAPSPSESTTVGDAPRCKADQLHTTFQLTGAAGGSQYGSLSIANTSTTPCRIDGVFRVAPIDSMGQTIAAEASWMNSALLGPTNIGGTTQIVAVVGGSYRDDPSPPYGSCSPSNEVTPAAWRVSLPGYVATVPNRSTQPPSAISACRGTFVNIHVQAVTR